MGANEVHERIAIVKVYVGYGPIVNESETITDAQPIGWGRCRGRIAAFPAGIGFSVTGGIDRS